MKIKLFAAGLLFLIAAAPVPTRGQEKSVKPGVNDAFQDPDVDRYVGVFEGESREVFAHRDKIVKLCRLEPGMHVADVGAGTGLYTRLFAKQVAPGGKVFAVDIAEKFIKHIEKSCKDQGIDNVVGVVCTDKSVTLPPASVDLAFVCDTYHHFEFPFRTLESIHQALKPNGRLIVIDFKRIEGVSREWILGHVRAGQDVFTREIIQSGFQLHKEYDLLEENYILEFTRVEKSSKPSP